MVVLISAAVFNLRLYRRAMHAVHQSTRGRHDDRDMNKCNSFKIDGSGWTHEVSERYIFSDVRVGGHICPTFLIPLLQRLDPTCDHFYAN